MVPKWEYLHNDHGAPPVNKQYPKMGTYFYGRSMRLIGLDIIDDFRSQNSQESWIWEVDALIGEMANRTWPDEQALRRDYPTAETHPPKVTFKVAGGKVLVECLVLFRQGIVLLKKLALRTTQKTSQEFRQTGDAA